MGHDLVRYVGTFTYADTAALDHASATARAVVCDDDPDEAFGATLRRRVAGTQLDIDFAIVWASGPRFAAAALIDALAASALAGMVIARRGQVIVDEFVAGDE